MEYCVVPDFTLYEPNIFSRQISRVKESVAVNPNPFSNTISIESTEEIYEIKILNIFGQEVFSNTIANKYKIEVNLEELPAGSYFLVINNSNYNQIIKK